MFKWEKEPMPLAVLVPIVERAHELMCQASDKEAPL
jgi:hypothetical protein